MKKVRILDFLVFAIFIALIVLTSFSLLGTSETLSVKAGDNEYSFSLNQSGIYSVNGILGETILEIKDGKVRFLDSPCPNKTCITKDFQNTVVCLPNGVIATTRGRGEDGGVDAIAR